MKTLFLTICISAVLFLNTNAQINFHIYGTIERSDVNKIYILNENKLVDSTDVKSGSFDLHGTYKEPAICRFIFICNKQAEMHPFILDNGDYKISIDANLKFIVESTSINQTLYLNWFYGDEKKANNKALDALFTDYKSQIEKGNYNLSAKYLAMNNDLQLKMLDFDKKLVTDHPDCFIVPRLLEGQEILTKENFGSTFDKFSPAVKNSQYGLYFKAKLEKQIAQTPDRNTTYFNLVGKIAPPLVSNLENGNIFDLSSLKGKWVFLDFWASWCGYCREEFPNMKKALEKFKDKNFVITSVSVDTDNSKWKNAILEDSSQVFIHSIIPDFQNSEIKKNYMIHAYPTSFLINPEGRIVDMNLREKELEETLARFIK